jgi:hypothetical protein
MLSRLLDMCGAFIHLRGLFATKKVDLPSRYQHKVSASQKNDWKIQNCRDNDAIFFNEGYDEIIVLSRLWALLPPEIR